MPKLYFQKSDDCCHPLDYYKKYMADNNINTLELFEAKRETGTGYFFCKEFSEVGENGNCGKVCPAYKPNNGKNGRCNHYGYVYEQTEKSITLVN